MHGVLNLLYNRLIPFADTANQHTGWHSQAKMKALSTAPLYRSHQAATHAAENLVLSIRSGRWSLQGATYLVIWRTC